MIEGMILGVCAMSMFSMLAVVCSDSGKDKLAMVFCGPACWLWVGVLKIVAASREAIKGNKYKSLLVCPDGEIRCINSRKTEIMLECADKEYKFADFAKLNVKANRWPKEYRITLGNQSVGSMRYTPKSVWKKYEEISKEDIKYAKAHQYKDQ